MQNKNKLSDFWQPIDLQMIIELKTNLSNYASKTGAANDTATRSFFIAVNSLQSLAAVFPLDYSVEKG